MHNNSIYLNNRRNIFFGYFCILLLSLGASSCQVPAEQEQDLSIRLIRQTCEYLWNQQKKDGGWHSDKHGILKGGQAYTPFIVLYLMEVPDSIWTKDNQKVTQALNFIRKNCNSTGVLGLSDPDVLEYPNYATSFALRVLLRHGSKQDQQRIQNMQKYLIEQQFDESRGISPNHSAYGSWGFGETNLSGGFVGHADLSHTRRALEALRESGVKNDSIYHKAKAFLKIVQNNSDGGFYYSPIITGANKGGRAPNSEEKQAQFQSYATATADGLMAGLAVGYDLQDESIKKALQWLKNHDQLSYVPGIPENNLAQWQKVMILYHVMVRSEVYAAIKHQENWHQEVVHFLKARQNKDGSFANPDGARNKENDPVLGSALALKALLCTLNRN